MRLIFLSLLICAFCTIYTKAESSNLFTYDVGQIEQELARLQSLENYVHANPGITLLGLQAEKCGLFTDLNLSNNFLSGFDDEEEGPPLGISPFMWGCCFGVWGIAIVYFVMDNKEATNKSLKGCVVGYVTGCAIYAGIYFVYFLIYGTYLFSYY